MFVAALDLGTTGCRTFIFDITGSILSSDYQEWESFYPVPSYVEQDILLPKHSDVFPFLFC